MRAKYTEIVSTHKAVLAKLLAEENIVVEFKNVDTAHFNLRDRRLVLPNMKAGLPECLYNLFTGHECGHALITPIDEWEYLIKNKICSHTILNIVEDVRVERVIKQRYPGIRKDFYEGYKELLQRDFFGIKWKNIHNMNFLDRLNIHAKCGNLIDIHFTEEEQAIVDACFAADHWEEVVELAKRIYNYMKQKKSEFKERAYDKVGPGEIEPEKPEKSKKKGQGNTDEMLDDILSDPSEDGAEKKEKEENEEEGEATTNEGGRHVGDKKEESGDEEVEEIDSETIEAMNEKLKDLLDQSKEEIINQYIPDSLKIKEIIVPWQTILPRLRAVGLSEKEPGNRTYQSYQIRHKESVDFLYTEFQLKKRAAEFQKTKVSKTGLLDGKKLFSYSFADDLFRRNESVPKGQSHGMVLFVDWSGSMITDIIHTIQQLFCLTDFCRKAEIPFEVYCFTDAARGDSYLNTFTPKQDEFHIGQFKLLNILSSKMKKKDYIETQKLMFHMIEYNLFSSVPHFIMNGTPLNECIIAALEIVPKFQTDNRLQIVNTIFLTDGQGALLHTATHIFGTEKTYIHDSKTKLSFRVNDKLGMDQKNILYRILKARTGSNVVGFFIEAETETQRVVNSYLRNVSITKQVVARSSFDKEYYMEIDDLGYDKLFILNRLGFDPKTKTITPMSTRPQFVEEAKFQQLVASKLNRLRSRVMLRRFIELIS